MLEFFDVAHRNATHVMVAFLISRTNHKWP